MTFLEVAAANMVSLTITGLLLIIEASILVGRTTGRGLRYLLQILGALLLFIISCAFLGPSER